MSYCLKISNILSLTATLEVGEGTDEITFKVTIPLVPITVAYCIV